MRAFLAATLLVAALAVTGCGSSSPSARQILANSIKAAEAASSLHMSGSLNSSGKQIGIDLWIAKGNGAEGSLTVGGAKVRLIIVGGNLYINAPASFLTQFVSSPQFIHLGGRWLKIPVSNPGQFVSFVAFSRPDILLGQLQSSADASLKNNGETTYKGQSVLALYDGASNGTLYVRATGTPYPVALVKTGSSGGAVAFGGWNHAVTLKAPKNVLAYTQVGG